jgi:hypothetical protein
VSDGLSYLITSASNQICWVRHKRRSSFPSRSLCVSGCAMIVQARFLPMQGRHFSSFCHPLNYKRRVAENPSILTVRMSLSGRRMSRHCFGTNVPGPGCPFNQVVPGLRLDNANGRCYVSFSRFLRPAFVFLWHIFTTVRLRNSRLSYSWPTTSLLQARFLPTPRRHFSSFEILRKWRPYQWTSFRVAL